MIELTPDENTKVTKALHELIYGCTMGGVAKCEFPNMVPTSILYTRMAVLRICDLLGIDPKTFVVGLKISPEQLQERVAARMQELPGRPDLTDILSSLGELDIDPNHIYGPEDDDETPNFGDKV